MTEATIYSMFCDAKIDPSILMGTSLLNLSYHMMANFCEICEASRACKI